MNRLFSLVLLVVPGALLTSSALAAPSRVVTLAPSLAELVAEILTPQKAAQRIVGITDYTNFPKELSTIPTVGSYARFNLEKVVSLKPDLVLAWQDGNAKDQIERLRELKIPVVVVATDRFSRITEAMNRVAESLGEAQAGKELSTRFDAGVKRVRARFSKKNKAKVLLQLGEDPLIVAGQGSFLSEALTAITAQNVYGDSSLAYPRPSIEDVIKRDPDRILVIALGEDLATFEKMALRWKQYPRLSAVKGEAVGILKSDELLRPSLRMIHGLEKLGEAVHGR